MALGILEPKSGEQVPGTTRYFDDPTAQPQQATGDNVSLKCDISGKVPIILIPQPSDDPNDPLNWPLWKRDVVTFVLCFAGILATSLGSILASNTIVMFTHFGISLSQTAVLTGYYLLGAGAAAVFFVPSGRVWGKRHLFLLGVCIVVASSAWAGAVGKNYKSMAAARAIQGVGAAPFESLLNAAVGDLYFVHQRGVRMAATNLAVFGGAFFTPIVVGKITQAMGWEWTFYLVSIFTAVTLPAVFLFCPETAYRRESRFNIDSIVEMISLDSKHASTGSPTAVDGASARQPGFVSFPTSSAMQPIGNASTPKKTFVQSLSLFDGRKTDERYWVLLLRPFPLLLNPAFIWGCLVQGTMIGWTVFIGVIIAVIFVGPPNFWGEVKTGYTYTSAVIGALLGFAISGLLADSSVKYLTKLNKGIYEPEFRILLVIPMLIMGGIGLYGFGLLIEDVASGKSSYIGLLIFFAFEVAGMVIGAVASSLYIVDAYRNLTIEGFTLMIIFKNMFSFMLTWYAYDWLIQSGFRDVLVIIASVQVGVCLLSIPLYIWGKRIRAFYHRHDLLTMAGLG
ncbi:Major facilitator superfamily domain, general substrate transporter [Ophiocordyceps sinensis CO18]|uniref:Major facilitator superfamily domain, general substrate transporter n=1 Tax=Ophiocordyceps sinensis (strain Co18 / CGMCC 3.14243) TaxID=911162 RepID=T5A7S9_OPHSC|nr:Major facilitator superfamily domain, general substrate transporter [Ophiocordyceps sinensis CO18]